MWDTPVNMPVDMPVDVPVDVPVEIPVERCLTGRDITEPRLSPDAAGVVYVVAAAGRAALVHHRLDGSPPRQLSSHPPPRPGRGMGGGCWCWTPQGDAVVYVGSDGDLWLQGLPAGRLRRLTDFARWPQGRTAWAPAVTPDGRHVVFTVDDGEVWCVSVVDESMRRLDDGSADFCFDPCPTTDGSAVSWQAWNVPDMPWDHARVQRVTLASGDVADVADVVGPEFSGSVQQPRSTPNGSLICVRDERGWANVWIGDAPLVEEAVEHADPSWGQGQRSFAVSPDGSLVAFTRNESGFGRLCVADVATGVVRDVARGVHGALSWEGRRLAALRSGARTPTQLVVYDTTTWTREVLAVGPLSGWEGLGLTEPDAVRYLARDGATLHARLYRATAPTGRLLCWVHGGPTDQWQVTFMPRLAYWRAQGWNVLVPDHRGSTGHGRAYQQAMNGRWGELDVADVADAIRFAHHEGVGTPERTVVIGASAGGFTALGVAATASELIAGTVASYPVADLADLAERSHRFERHSTIHLVGPLPEAADEYRRRSPVHRAAAIAARPLLLLHGDSDPVVPVEQSRTLAAAVAAAGGRVELHEYQGEGHGLRQPEHQLDEYARIGAFLSGVAHGG